MKTKKQKLCDNKSKKKKNKKIETNFSFKSSLKVERFKKESNKVRLLFISFGMMNNDQVNLYMLHLFYMLLCVSTTKKVSKIKVISMKMLLEEDDNESEQKKLFLALPFYQSIAILHFLCFANL